MEHTTEIVHQDQPNDECVCLTYRCCGDSKSDSTMTIFQVNTLSQDEITAIVDLYHDKVAVKHAAMIAGRTFLQHLPNQTKAHPGLLPMLPEPVAAEPANVVTMPLPAAPLPDPA